MQPKTLAEKELMKEGLYHNRVQTILQKHKGILQAAYASSPDTSKDGGDPSLAKSRYAAERAIIERVTANERSALLNGLALAGIAFASVRYGPRWLAVKINPEKARMLREADEAAERAHVRWAQKATALFFETLFGAWAGWRGYSMVSSQNESSHEEISRIPLCAGRSGVSESVCPDWVDLVHREIPPAFWKNLDDGEDCRLNDPQRWRSVRDFADNCVKRRVYEDYYRKRNGLQPGAPVDIPEPGVPDDILLSLEKMKASSMPNDPKQPQSDKKAGLFGSWWGLGFFSGTK